MLRFTRRQFLKYCSVAAGALGLSASTLMKLEKASADIADTGPEVVWIAGQACSGCITSLLNSIFYWNVGTLLLDKIDLNFEGTVNAAPGVFINGVQQPYSATSVTSTLPAGGYVLCVEGATPTAAPLGGVPGDFCHIGDMDLSGDPKMTTQLVSLATNAALVLAIGTCSSWGGIPAARGSITGATDTASYLTSQGVTTPVVKLPGCPPHPDWIVGTVITYMSDTNIANAVVNLKLTPEGAPGDYYREYQCNAGPCIWRYNNDGINNVTQARVQDGIPDDTNAPGLQQPFYQTGVVIYNQIGNSGGLGGNKWASTDVGCIGIIGCKGRKTKADCSARKWNSDTIKQYGVNWCVESRGGCHGCTNPGFPDGVGKFFTFA